MTKVALLIEDMYQEAEALVPYYRLQEAGFQVDVVGPEVRVYSSKHGYPLKATVASKDARADDYVAVVIPGGYAPDRMRRDKAMVDFVREMDRQGKVVAAICHAGWMLVEADILRGRRATSFFSIRKDMENAGAHWVDEAPVVDGNLITARTPDDLPVFLRAIVEALKEKVA